MMSSVHDSNEASYMFARPVMLTFILKTSRPNEVGMDSSMLV